VTTVHHTPLSNGEDANASTFNGPLSALDYAIETLRSGSLSLTAPQISSFINAIHDHESNAEGGKLSAAAITSTPSDAGDVLTSDGAGGADWQAFAVVPTGAILPYGGGSAPSGWLLCDGAAVSRTTYDDLFTAIGTAYGVGDGSTTFNVPDLRGRYPLGADNMGGASADRVTSAQADSLGGADGSETHTLIESEIPAHVHTIDVTVAGGTGGYVGAGSVSSVSPDKDTESTGGDGAHNNMPPYLTVNYIIRT
jgi:microcystin-dependent protein